MVDDDYETNAEFDECNVTPLESKKVSRMFLTKANLMNSRMAPASHTASHENQGARPFDLTP